MINIGIRVRDRIRVTVCRGMRLRVDMGLYSAKVPSVCCCTTFWKLEVRVLAYLEENADENVTYYMIFEHTPNFNALNLLIYLIISISGLC